MSFPIKRRSSALSPTRIVSKEDILNYLEEYQKSLSFYRYYPDRLIDLYVEASGPDCSFKLFDYQRLMLRSLARHKEVFLTFSRGTSKSFISVLWAFICAILYPNSKIAIAATTKGQSGAILEAKVEEILNLLPILEFEIRKKEKVKDQLILHFKNGSTVQNLAAKQSSRGLRFTALYIEEIIEGDPDVIQEVLIPTLAIQRRAANGLFDRGEVVSQQKVSITTAGVKDSFAYNTLLRTVLRQLTEPDQAISLGGSYRIPIIAGLQNMDFIRRQKLSGTFNPAAFGREYMSRWAIGSEKAFYSGEVFDRYRSLREPVFEREEKLAPGVDYIFGIDVGRLSDTSEVAIWKYIPQKGTTSTKHLVNIYTFERMHFSEQAVEIKLLYEKFKPEKVVIDGAGLGVGLVDELIKPQIDVRTNQYLRPWGVANDEKGYYGQFKTADTITDLLYIVKANAAFNTAHYGNLQTQLTTGKLRFLVDERQAKLKVDASRAKRFLEMSDEDKMDWVLPFALTSILKDQMINLEERKSDGVQIALKEVNKNIKKDKVSAMSYALWYIKTEIDDVVMRQKTMSWDQLLKLPGKASGFQRSSPRLTFRGDRNYTSRLRK